MECARSPHGIRRALAVALVAVLLGVASLLLHGCAEEWAGADGIGDRYFPRAGNEGYDVLHYTIRLAVRPNDGSLAGSTTIEALSLRGLDSYSLDYAGPPVSGVTMDGQAVVYDRDDDELRVWPPRRLEAGEEFSVAVTYAGIPEVPAEVEGFSVGWRHVGDVIYTLDQPWGAATWYPVNDHPSDKATYSFHVTVPEPYVAVANGTLAKTEAVSGDRTYSWEMSEPMASYLAAVTVDRLVERRSKVREGLVLRDYFAEEVAAAAERVFANTQEALLFFERLFGPYPFDTYGVVVPDASTGAAMENQTLSLFGRDVLERMADDRTAAVYLSHELAHQWFGNSVTITRWSDIWLNEGFATYAGWLWLEHEYGAATFSSLIEDSYRDLERDRMVAPADPGKDRLLGTSVYRRGALALHALRTTVGDDVFFGILRTWAERHRHGNATTEDFLALVGEMVAATGKDGAGVRALLEDWLFERKMPELPAGA